MKKIILIPDSFKGTMSSQAICDVLATSVKGSYPDAQIISIPVADGGEGSVDAFLAAVGGKKVSAEVTGPLGEKMTSSYGVLQDGTTAVIEMAACAGLPLVEGRMQPDKTTTFGVGELMAHALRKGCKKIILGLGGSCTNDFGVGAAAALGVKFYSDEGQAFLPAGGTLEKIHDIDLTCVIPELHNVEIVTMCDIDNPLYGEKGAAYVFAPQKGADAALVRVLDDQLRSISDRVAAKLGVDVSQIPGSGAAGGMGGGMVAFFSSTLKMGIDTVLDTVEFDDLLTDADLVITGEGKIDSQSLSGKVVIGVARRAKLKNVPVIAVVGDIGEGAELAYDEGVSSILSINRLAIPFEEARKHSREDLKSTADNLMRTLRAFGW